MKSALPTREKTLKMSPAGLPRRILNKIHVQENGGSSPPCWIWTGSKTTAGYGNAQIKSGSVAVGYVHRMIYEAFKGAIPEDRELDHLCRIRHCVNPDHLEAVSRAENQRRGLNGILKTHCVRGHSWIEENLTSYRRPHSRRGFIKRCKICHREQENERYHGK